ncbi:MAG TPA: hypothetical protein VEK15_21460 [Vicinamibacteria bacterium]|nr:hypothetical protein [Vicinamibacteria bacterium]
MDLVIRLSKPEELKAIPILLRHSPGTVLPNGTYIISGGAAKALRAAGIEFQEISRLTHVPPRGGASGERV